MKICCINRYLWWLFHVPIQNKSWKKGSCIRLLFSMTALCVSEVRVQCASEVSEYIMNAEDTETFFKMFYRDLILFLRYRISYQQHVLRVSALSTTEKNVFTAQSNTLCVHSECTLAVKWFSSCLILLSTESSKPQSPSKRLSVSRGIKQLFQSATKFVRLLQR